MTPPFKCGQCGSKSLYKDEDIVEGNRWIACRICGNRWPGGKEPIRITEEGKGDMSKRGKDFIMGQVEMMKREYGIAA